jgi:hypothetical protein
VTTRPMWADGGGLHGEAFHEVARIANQPLRAISESLVQQGVRLRDVELHLIKEISTIACKRVLAA